MRSPPPASSSPLGQLLLAGVVLVFVFTLVCSARFVARQGDTVVDFVILQMNDVKERLLFLGMDPIGGSAQEFAALIKKDIARWAKAIKAAGVKPE